MTEPAAARLQPAEVLARSGSNFGVGFLCLGAERRAGMTAIYAFCRAADDAADDAAAADEARAQLAFWRRELEAAAAGTARTAVGRELGGAIGRFGVAPAHLHALLDGVSMDIESAGCADQAALERYCWHVASAVGLACLPVLGATGEVAERYADRLGRALQVTNILRDLRTDAECGRVYAPRDWLQADGVEPAWLRGGGPDAVYGPSGPVAALCGRLHALAGERFAEAFAALRALPAAHRRALLPARIMGTVYGDLLARLRRRGGDLRQPRVRVPKGRRLWLAGLCALGVRA